MKSLVIGGNGFIGSHLVDALLLAGHKVRVLDRRKETFRLPLQEVEYCLVDFNDVHALAKALEKIDIVFHLLSTTVPSTSNLDPVEDIDSNLKGTVKLLQLMVQKKISRIVYLSSGGTVYGIPHVIPIPETHALSPLCSYGIVKIAVEHFLFMFQEIHGIQPIVLRAANAYGERQGHEGVQGIIGTLLKRINSEESIDIWGDGSIIRDFIHVSDLVDLCMRAGTGNKRGIFNAGNGKGYSISEILSIAENITQRPVKKTFRPSRTFDIPTVVLDISKAKSVFGWNPEIEISEGISKTWQWLHEHHGPHL